MPSIATIEDIKNEGNLLGIADEILVPHLSSAELELRKLITSNLYDTVQQELNTPRKRELVKAESNLALSYAVHVLNIETQGKGIVASTGWDQSRNDLLRRNEVNDLSDYFRRVAMEFIQPYLPTPDFTNINEDDILTIGNQTIIII